MAVDPYLDPQYNIVVLQTVAARSGTGSGTGTGEDAEAIDGADPLYFKGSISIC
jgi:hypothetical protein